MVATLDFGASSLLCAEDNSSIFQEVESGGVVIDEFEINSWDTRFRNYQPFSKDSISNCGDEFLFSGLDAIFERERQLLPCRDYLNRLKTGQVDLDARNQAVDWVLKVQSHFNFGPLCANLSINYLDRFLSAYELPKGRAWMMQLLAVACISLAAKMEETKIPLLLDLQVEESRFVFEAKTIQRMELVVMSTLKWRMQSVTPFCFLDYFFSKICGDQQIPPRALFTQASQLIIRIIKGIEFLELRPSVIAAAVAVCVASETYSTDDTEKAISVLSEHVEKGELDTCIKKIQDLGLRGDMGRFGKSNGGGDVPESPIGVLNASTCLSYRSDDTTNNSPLGYSANSHPKRRKLNF